MKNSISKTKMTALIAIVLLMASVTLMSTNIAVQPVKAQLAAQQPVIGLPTGVTPDVSVNTLAHISFRPNPVGVGQPILVNIWIQPPVGTNKRVFGYTVTITKPDGTTDVMGPFSPGSQDSTTWFEYVVDQVGTWKLRFDFPGNYFPAGRYLGGVIVTNTSGTLYPASAYYLPSTTEDIEKLTLTVQTDMVASWPQSPLPTDYWTRPVEPANREWWPILGNWPWSGPGGGPVWDSLYPDTNAYSSNYLFNAYVQGPNSSHIVWKRQNMIAGIVGPMSGQDTLWGDVGYYPSIVYAGRAYQTITKPMSILINGTYILSPTDVWQCYDIRTGEVIWERTGVGAQDPTVIEYSGTTVNLVYIGGGRLIKYNPNTGAVSLNVSISPLTTGTYYMNGYALTVQNIGNTTVPNYRLINWTTTGTSTTLAARIRSNITWPFSSVGTVDYEANINVNTMSVTPPAVGSATEVWFTAADMATGTVLWNISGGQGFGTFSGSTLLADHGKFAARINNGYWYCWDLYSGKLLWQSTLTTWPWGTFGTYNQASYDGMILSSQFDGVAALDWDTGKTVWYFASEAAFPYEAPYTGPNGTTVYPFHTHCSVADGKLYIGNGEHTATQPATRGWEEHCFNITTGEEIWHLTCGSNGLGDASRVFQGAIADGYMALNNQYDGYMYVFGKGKSATTVTAPDVAVPLGTAVLIKGTVLDQSPAQPGTPCVSHDSMSTQMEYLHMQMPIGGLWGNETVIGVPVMLTAYGSDGTVIDIGTVTTNGYYGTFSTAWTPPAEGTYEIVATFVADDSYGSSSASTAVAVSAAPAASPTATASPTVANPPYEMYTLGTGIAIIITVIVVSLLILRKRPYYPPKI